MALTRCRHRRSASVRSVFPKRLLAIRSASARRSSKSGITSIIRQLRGACNRATYPGSSAISTSLATALARRIWRGVRHRTLSSLGLATTTARQRARLVATFSRFRL